MSVIEKGTVDSSKLMSVSTSTDEGIGCLLTSGAFAIVLWVLYTYGIPVIKFIFGG